MTQEEPINTKLEPEVVIQNDSTTGSDILPPLETVTTERKVPEPPSLSLTTHIPPEFAHAVYTGTITEETHAKLNSLLPPGVLARFFKEIPEAEVKDNGAKYKFIYAQLISDISATLPIDIKIETLLPHYLIAMGTIAVDRIREKELPVFFLRSPESEAIKPLLARCVPNRHPGLIVGRNLTAMPDPQDPEPLVDAGYVLLDLDRYFVIQDAHIVVSDLDFVKAMLNSDDTLCSDEEWTPRAVNILGQPFLVELPPYWYNMWKNAFETDSFNATDIESFANTKQRVAYRIVNESTTLEFRVNFKIDPRFLLGDWSIRDEIVDPDSGQRKQLLYFDDNRSIDTCVFQPTPTEDVYRLRIQEQRLAKNPIDATKIVSRTPFAPTPPRCEIIKEYDNGVGIVRYDKIHYNITEPIAWGEVENMIEAKGDYVECKKNLKSNFKKQSLDFFNVAIETEKLGRGGKRRYRIRF